LEEIAAALNEASSFPRMVVVLRWREKCFDDAERMELAKFVRQAVGALARPVIVLDIGQESSSQGNPVKVGIHDLYVVSLGLTPAKVPPFFYPRPGTPDWSWNDEEPKLLRDLEARLNSPISNAALPVRHRFILDRVWETAISSHDESQVKLRITMSQQTISGPSPTCTFSLRFPEAPHSEDLSRRLTLLSVAMWLAAILLVLIAMYTLYIWAPFLRTALDWLRRAMNG
jgi:hypothetical protein